MSHRHFCDAAGHDWYCDGKALRPIAGDTKPTTCMCVRHEVPMEQGDHSACPVELLACPEHRDEQQRKMNEAASIFSHDGLEADTDTEPVPWQDKDGKPIVGFCLWCNRDFYTMEEVWEHNAADSASCEPYQQFIATQSASASMPEDAEPQDGGEPQ